MNQTWLKVKAWAKGILAGLLLLYTILFVVFNSYDVQFWYWFGHRPTVSAAFIALVAFLAGSLFTAVVWTTLRTLRQVRGLKSGRRLDRIERELAEAKVRAAGTMGAVPPRSTVAETE